MQNKKAFRLLNTWAKPYLYADEHNMKLIFDENAPIGTGKTNEIEHKIIISIEPLKLNGLSKYQQIKDADFVKIGVTVFHEITHHEQETQNDIPKEIKISELSKLKPSHIFKIPVPEISEEIRNRLDLDDSFTKAVESLNPNDSRLML